MSLKKYINRLKNEYIINKAARTKLPEFNESPIERKKIIFSGRVQNVGFRLEVYEMANLLKLTGWVKNLGNGDVESEIQGERDRIQFLIDNMKDLKRAKVINVDLKKISLIRNEEDFKIVG